MSKEKSIKKQYKKRGQMAETWSRLKQQPLAVVSLIVVAFVLFLAIFADLLVPYSAAITQNGMEKLLPSFFTGTSFRNR